MVKGAACVGLPLPPNESSDSAALLAPLLSIIYSSLVVICASTDVPLS